MVVACDDTDVASHSPKNLWFVLYRCLLVSVVSQCRTVQSVTGKIVFARLDQSDEDLIWPDMNGKGNEKEW